MDREKDLMEGIDAKLGEHGFGVEKPLSEAEKLGIAWGRVEAAIRLATKAIDNGKKAKKSKDVARYGKESIEFLDEASKFMKSELRDIKEDVGESFEEAAFSFAPSRQQQVQAVRDSTSGAAGKISQALFVGVEDEYSALATKMYGIVKRNLENAVQEGVKMMKGHKKSTRSK